MNTENNHTLRLALVLALMVVVLVVVSVDQYRADGNRDQEAAVLRVYAD